MKCNMQDVCLKTHRQVGHGTIGLKENSSFARFASRRTSNGDMAACRFLELEVEYDCVEVIG